MSEDGEEKSTMASTERPNTRHTLEQLKEEYYEREWEAGNLTPSDEEAGKWAEEQSMAPKIEEPGPVHHFGPPHHFEKNH